jgi:hypothetical protein
MGKSAVARISRNSRTMAANLKDGSACSDQPGGRCPDATSARCCATAAAVEEEAGSTAAPALACAGSGPCLNFERETQCVATTKLCTCFTPEMPLAISPA